MHYRTIVVDVTRICSVFVTCRRLLSLVVLNDVCCSVCDDVPSRASDCLTIFTVVACAYLRFFDRC